MEDSGQKPLTSQDGNTLDGSAVKYKSLSGAAPPGAVHGCSDKSSHASLELDDLSPLLAPVREGVFLSEEEQEAMFRALRDVFERAEEDLGSFDVQDLLTSLDMADSDARRGRQNLEALQEVRLKLDQLWRSNSIYMAQATELLANGSRNPKWRAPYGSSGILDFYLQIVATPDVDNEILLHAMRLIGNSCADTDRNRQTVLEKNYTLPIIRLFSNQALAHVAIPVVYNICADFEPAQARTASDGILYILLRLLTGAMIQGDALLACAYELIEMASDQAHTIEKLPDDSLRLIFALAEESEIDHARFASVVNVLLALLRSERFQMLCITDRLVENMLSVLEQSYQLSYDEPSAEAEASLAQLRLKINQALSDISVLPTFPREYPLSSSMTKTLLSWLGQTSKDQLQICACVMLGNVAREDEVCESLIRDFEIQVHLVSILNSDAKGSVLHAVLGFLKNLAIAGNNREYLGAAGVIKAISRLWTFDSIPHVQFMATSLTRQVIGSSLSNITRLLDSLSPDPDSPANSRTYLSLLLALFSKTDSSPIRTEIGRTVAAICRSILRVDEEGSFTSDAAILVDKVFGLHEDVARPIGAMVTQKEWPVVQSEGWFALALMASSKPGSQAAADCIENMSVTGLLSDTVRISLPEKPNEESTETTDMLRKAKDRDNALVLIHELLKHNPPGLSQTRRDMLDDLMRETGQVMSI